MYCIRETRTNKLLGVSFTEDGLKYVANSMGKILLFRNARFTRKGDKVILTGDLRPNPKVYITKYSRMSHRDYMLDKIEHFWEKAIDLKSNYQKYQNIRSSVTL